MELYCIYISWGLYTYFYLATPKRKRVLFCPVPRCFTQWFVWFRLSVGIVAYGSGLWLRVIQAERSAAARIAYKPDTWCL